MYLYGTQAANIYGTLKLHKSASNNESPFRPMVISRGAYNYDIAKYLCNLLIPYILSEYCASDTFLHI